jgi:hypothetical protein
MIVTEMLSVKEIEQLLLSDVEKMIAIEMLNVREIEEE